MEAILVKKESVFHTKNLERLYWWCVSIHTAKPPNPYLDCLDDNKFRLSGRNLRLDPLKEKPGAFSCPAPKVL